MHKEILHQLIHSLSSFEKGYYIKSKGDSHMTTLFNAMNKLDVYNKAALEKQLSKHPEIIKHIAKYKTNTYSDILRVMRSYRQEKTSSVAMRLRASLMDIVFLKERGLFEEAMKILKNAKKLATEYEKYKILLEIIQYEIDLCKRLYAKGYIEITRSLIEEEDKIMALLNNRHSYGALAHRLDFVFQRNGNSNEDGLQKANELMSDELLVNEKRAISFISKKKYNYIYSFYHYITDNWEKSYAYQKKSLDYWDRYPHQKQEDFMTYLRDVYNYLNTSVKLKQYTTFEHVLAKVKKEIKPKNPYEKATVFWGLYYPESFYHLRRANFEKLEGLVAEIQPKLKKYSAFLIGKEIHDFKMSINTLLFIMDKYEEAYQGFIEIIKQKLPIRIDFQCVAWLFKLIIAFEQNYEQFDNLYRSAKRFFNKLKPEEMEKGYSLFMKFLYQVNGSPLSKAKALYLKYQAALQKMQDTNYTVGLNEIIVWMEHMIHQKSQMEIYKERALADSAS